MDFLFDFYKFSKWYNSLIICNDISAVTTTVNIWGLGTSAAEAQPLAVL